MEPTPTYQTGYQIRVAGRLSQKWAEWFDGMAITREDEGTTLITGPQIDQAALHGILKKIRDTGLPLVSVIQININESHS